MTVAQSLVTADDLFNLPSSVRNELIRGELKTMSPAADRHGTYAARLTMMIGTYIDAQNLGEPFTADPGFILSRNPDTVRAPDFAFVSNGRLAIQPLTGKFYPGAPDLAVEVLSPSDTVSDTNEKIDDYLNAGTRLLWIIDPKNKTVTVYAPNRQPTVLRIADSLSGEDVLPGFTLPIAKIFR